MDQIVHLRSTLLQLQFVYEDLKYRLEQQKQHLELRLSDRLCQYHELSQELQELTISNTKNTLLYQLDCYLLLFKPDIDLAPLLPKLKEKVDLRRYELREAQGKVAILPPTHVNLTATAESLQKVVIQMQVYNFLSSYLLIIKEVIESHRICVQHFDQNLSNLVSLRVDCAKFMKGVWDSIETWRSPYWKYLGTKLKSLETSSERKIQSIQNSFLF